MSRLAVARPALVDRLIRNWYSRDPRFHGDLREAALAGLGGEKDIVLIAGGQGKDADFNALRELVQRHCKSVLLLGEDAALIATALAGVAEIEQVDDMRAAVDRAAVIAGEGDTVLLSPACASFDMFTGFAARGDAFREAVAALEVGV